MPTRINSEISASLILIEKKFITTHGYMKVKNTRIYLIIHLYKEFTYVTGISHHCSLFINSTFCHLPNLALTKARKNCLPEARLGLFQHHRSCSGPLVLLTHTTDVFYLCGISVSTKSPTIG